jgi:hypothetical protein
MTWINVKLMERLTPRIKFPKCGEGLKLLPRRQCYRGLDPSRPCFPIVPSCSSPHSSLEYRPPAPEAIATPSWSSGSASGPAWHQEAS